MAVWPGLQKLGPSIFKHQPVFLSIFKKTSGFSNLVSNIGFCDDHVIFPSPVLVHASRVPFDVILSVKGGEQNILFQKPGSLIHNHGWGLVQTFFELEQSFLFPPSRNNRIGDCWQ